MTAGKVHKGAAYGIFILMLGTYLMTVAPTLSFWDCGEFITCSYIMGIPHPPGSPMLSLIGRVFSLVPFYDFRGTGLAEIAYRVNMIDVLLGALTVMLTYLIMVRLIHLFRPYEGNRLEEAFVGVSAAVTALMAGFSDEFWNNAIETETYMPSLFMQMLAVWLTLKWHERRDEPGSVRYLFLAAYLVGLGNGVHLTVLLIAPTLFLFVLFTKPDWFREPKLWISLAVFLGVAGIIKAFAGLYMLYATMFTFALAAPWVLNRFSKKRQPVWKYTLIGLVLCSSLYVLGFSVYPTVMVRAGKSPAINEGNPDNWERYRLYMERDQYGQENMYVGMFTRNASFSYQFGYMYLRYLITQFPKWGPTFQMTFTNNRSADQPGQDVEVSDEVYISIFLVSLLLYGLYTHAREDWRRFVPLALFFVASSAGLILYLNMQNPQVRERGYFFLGSYYIIMYWIGMGIYGLMIDIRDWLVEKNMDRAVVPASVMLFLISGTLPVAAVLSNHIDRNFTNYEVHDRSRDWAPWDYGYNILSTCEENSILFTNGDNDTFPLWYVQYVAGFRQDVRVVNLSLLNTSWYILQMKYEGKTIPIEFSDEYITDRLCGRENDDLMLRLWPIKGKVVNVAGMSWTLPPQSAINDEYGMIRIQDVMVSKIIEWVNWERPIYFAVTVAESNKAGLQEHLAMEGMALRLEKEKGLAGEPYVNVVNLDHNLFEVYQYRTLSDENIYKSPNTVKLVTNYFIGFAQLCERYLQIGDEENATRAAWGAVEKTSSDLEKRLLLYKIMFSGNMRDGLRPFLEREITNPEFASGYMGSMGDRLEVAALLDMSGRGNDTEKIVAMEQARIDSDNLDEMIGFGSLLLEKALDEYSFRYFSDLVEQYPNDADLLKAYAAVLYSSGREQETLEILKQISTLNPSDRTVKETIDFLERQIERKNAPADSMGAAQ